MFHRDQKLMVSLMDIKKKTMRLHLLFCTNIIQNYSTTTSCSFLLVFSSPFWRSWSLFGRCEDTCLTGNPHICCTFFISPPLPLSCTTCQFFPFHYSLLFESAYLKSCYQCSGCLQKSQRGGQLVQLLLFAFTCPFSRCFYLK